MAKFVKGKPKTGGRKKGTPNRTTQEMRDFLQKVLDDQLNSLPEDFKKMSVGTKWQIWAKLKNSVMPDLQKSEGSIEHSGEIDYNINFNFEDSLGLTNDKKDDDVNK